MASTPRLRLTQIPLPTRNSEAGAECFGRVVLSYLREDEQIPAAYFVLGDVLHRSIQEVIEKNITMQDMDVWLESVIERERALWEPPTGSFLESSQRGWKDMLKNFERMMRNWFTQVHPDSEKRHPIYDEWDWPPQAEVSFLRSAASTGTRYPVWGTVDAVFMQGKNRMIVDYKSGVKRPTSDFQLNFYRFGLDELHAPAHYHMLDRVRQSSVVVPAEAFPGVAEMRRAISLTERHKDATVKGYMPKFSPDWYCNYCPVQHLCPADGDLRNRETNYKNLEKLLSKVEGMQEIGARQ